MRTTRFFLFALTGLTLAACGPNKRGDDDDDGIPDAPPPDAPCNTSISGKVFAPNGTLPLYNVTVYIPQNPPGPMMDGLQCAQCSTSLPGGSVTQTKTDAEGKFILDSVPPGTDVPIIITTGKWRRQLTVPFVGQCVDTPVMDGFLRLPKNRNEGDLPKIAVVTGGCDPLACILSKMGIDATEFGSNSAGPERVTFYNGQGGTAPGTPQPSTALWENLNEMKKFDMVINSCECSEYNTNKLMPDLLKQYADQGGRVFGSHFHYTWTKNLIPAWQGTADWVTNPSSVTPDLVDTSHPDGQALAKWLTAVGASTVPGQITLGTKTYDAGPVVPPTTRWLYNSGSPAASHYLSFKTPVGVQMDQQCGKVVYAGMHVSSGSVGTTFPASCSTSFTPDEKALVFLLFDLGSCVDIIF
ncbi:MAG TPA: carboxypeptidase-like regulatory domain-containing protein [Kofleriaceae bacterium]